ncbi:MAG TPA: response regulator [Longimicrobiaceae bacterium]|jgi:PleD family two-component response regulator|nr:response regulator [Longimicrobiaceae bacterium]
MDLEDIKSASILLVDDEEANIRILQRFLTKEGYTDVHGATQGREVMATFGEVKPDLVIMDLHMPFPDGFVILDWLGSAIPKAEYLPIMIVTGDLSVESKNRALVLGAKDFLTKPFDFFEARYRIRNLLQTRALYLQLERYKAAAGESPSAGTDGPDTNTRAE